MREIFGDYMESVTEDVLAKIKRLENLKIAAEHDRNRSFIYSFNYFEYLNGVTGQ